MNDDVLARKNEGQKRDRVLEDFNRSPLDDVGPAGGGEQGMKVLSEMNDLAELEGGM